MDKQDIIKKAAAYARALAALSALSAANRPSDPEERVRRDVQYMLAQDIEKKAYDDYYGALALLSSDDLIELSNQEPSK